MQQSPSGHTQVDRHRDPFDRCSEQRNNRQHSSFEDGRTNHIQNSRDARCQRIDRKLPTCRRSLSSAGCMHLQTEPRFTKPRSDVAPQLCALCVVVLHIAQEDIGPDRKYSRDTDLGTSSSCCTLEICRGLGIRQPGGRGEFGERGNIPCSLWAPRFLPCGDLLPLELLLFVSIASASSTSSGAVPSKSTALLPSSSTRFSDSLGVFHWKASF